MRYLFTQFVFLLLAFSAHAAQPPAAAIASAHPLATDAGSSNAVAIPMTKQNSSRARASASRISSGLDWWGRTGGCFMGCPDARWL